MALLLGAACVIQVPPPPTPSPTAIMFDVVADAGYGAVQGADINVDGIHRTCCPDGVTTWTKLASQPTVDVTVTAPGYKPAHEVVDFHTGPNPHIIRLTRWGADEGGFVRPSSPVLVTDAGDWQWIGITDFSLFWRFLNGEDIGPIVDERAEMGFRVLRVFGSMENIAHLWPQEHPDYDDRLAAFFDYLADRQIRVEFTVFADAVNKVDYNRSVMPKVSDQQAFYQRVAAVARGRWNVFLETCNECEQNGVVPANFPHPGLIASSGSGMGDGMPSLPYWDFITYHGSRGNEWPRDGKSSLDIREGWGGDQPFGGTHRYSVQDEPMGAAEVNIPGKRSNVPDDFAYFAGVSALNGGATFHCEDCIHSNPLPPIQRACAEAFVAAMKWIPASAPRGPYQRGSASGGAGIGNMPLQHFDNMALRTFCTVAEGAEYCVAVRPQPEWVAQPLRGCQIVDQPRRGFVKLVCP